MRIERSRPPSPAPRRRAARAFPKTERPPRALWFPSIRTAAARTRDFISRKPV
ncbi:hypothetical protein GBP346_B0098 [Burkholderia pseudomallei MSHR346]|nr:hypothetical protein GBP346_B0098 [Burkholderia pseudomallei MSHR346]